MASKEHSAGGVIFEDGSVLLILAKNLKGDRVWTFPKGHLEAGETPEAAAIREVSEETGWDCEITSPRVGGDGLPKTPDEVLDMKWLPLAEAENELIYKSDLEIIDLLKKF